MPVEAPAPAATPATTKPAAPKPAAAKATVTTAKPTTTTTAKPAEHVTLRLGYFPNVTHASAIAGIEKGIYADNLGPDVDLKTSIFNAGGAATEALFSGAIDATFIGPSPAINGFVKSKGDALRVVAGATSGGASLVVKPNINSAADLKGQKVATPQLGNTQDVAARAYFLSQGEPVENESFINRLLAAAEQGVPRAQIKLAEAYAEEPGISGSQATACGWFLLAAMRLRGIHLHRAQSEYERLSSHLTPAQIASRSCSRVTSPPPTGSTPTRPPPRTSSTPASPRPPARP